MSKERNRLSTLNHYARRQEENFLTESLAYTLELLREREPEAFQALVALSAGKRYLRNR